MKYILKKSNEEVAGLFMPILKEHGIEAPMDKSGDRGRLDERSCKFYQGFVGNLQILLRRSYGI